MFDEEDNHEILERHEKGRFNSLVPHATSSETFSPNAIGVGAINGVPASAPTPMALGLNVELSFMTA